MSDQFALKEIYAKSPPKTKAEVKEILAKHTTDGNWFERFLTDLLPKLVNYTNFTEDDFSKAVSVIVKENKDDLSELCMDYLDLCEPLLFKGDCLLEGVKRIPSPHCELTAAYQFWAMMEGDGIASYFGEVPVGFDAEAVEGFKLLGLNVTASVVSEARELYDEEELDFGEVDDDYFEDKIDDEVEDFESILGEYLQKIAKV